MILSNMKPLPRFLIIGAGVAAIVFGAKFIMERMPAKPAVTETKVEAPTAVPAEAAAPVAPPVVQAPVAPAPVAEAPVVLQPANQDNAAFDNVLRAAGKK